MRCLLKTNNRQLTGCLRRLSSVWRKRSMLKTLSESLDQSQDRVNRLTSSQLPVGWSCFCVSSPVRRKSSLSTDRSSQLTWWTEAGKIGLLPELGYFPPRL